MTIQAEPTAPTDDVVDRLMYHHYMNEAVRDFCAAQKMKTTPVIQPDPDLLRDAAREIMRLRKAAAE